MKNKRLQEIVPHPRPPRKTLARLFPITILALASSGCGLAAVFLSLRPKPEFPFNDDSPAVFHRGCLDIATRLVSDKAISEDIPIVDIWFRNKCGQVLKIDLSQLDVSARWEDNAWIKLDPFDPAKSIAPEKLPPDNSHRVIAFPPASPHENIPPIEVCVNFEKVSSQGDGPATSCFNFEEPKLPAGGAP
jgi:hypothetical protein